MGSIHKCSTTGTMDASYYNVEAVETHGVLSFNSPYTERVRVYDRLMFKLAPNIRVKGEDDYMKQYNAGMIVGYTDYWVTSDFAKDNSNWNL